MSRPTLVYSPKSSTSITYLSSRGSSRASTPPSTSYYASLEADPVATMRQLSRQEEGEHGSSTRIHHSLQQKRFDLQKLMRKRPSKASLLHYLSLLLSLRLLLHTRRVWLLVLTILLAITLEGRAKIEKLGLRGTMTICLTLVGVGLAMGNIGIGWGWTSVGATGSRQGCGKFSSISRGSTVLNNGDLGGLPSAVMTMAVCAQGTRSSGEVSQLPEELLHSAKLHMVDGDLSASVSALQLCRQASHFLRDRYEDEMSKPSDRFAVQIALDPAANVRDVIAISTEITCQFSYA